METIILQLRTFYVMLMSCSLDSSTVLQPKTVGDWENVSMRFLNPALLVLTVFK